MATPTLPVPSPESYRIAEMDRTVVAAPMCDAALGQIPIRN